MAVPDGDQIVAVIHGRQVTIRLSGIDSPEKDQPHGEAARIFTGMRYLGRPFALLDSRESGNGKIKGVVIFGDGANLNLEIVRAGYAWWDRQDAPRDDSLAGAEYEARFAESGLWADRFPIPPWEWSRGRRNP